MPSLWPVVGACFIPPLAVLMSLGVGLKVDDGLAVAAVVGGVLLVAPLGMGIVVGRKRSAFVGAPTTGWGTGILAAFVSGVCAFVVFFFGCLANINLR